MESYSITQFGGDFRPICKIQAPSLVEIFNRICEFINDLAIFFLTVNNTDRAKHFRRDHVRFAVALGEDATIVGDLSRQQRNDFFGLSCLEV